MENFQHSNERSNLICNEFPTKDYRFCKSLEGGDQTLCIDFTLSFFKREYQNCPLFICPPMLPLDPRGKAHPMGLLIGLQISSGPIIVMDWPLS